MTKKLVCLLVGFLLITFIFSFAMNAPLYAQEEEEEEESEDIEDFSLEELLDVEITTAGKQAERIADIPASVVVVTREDIEKYGYQSLVEVLQNIPGLYSIDDYVGPNFGVRGFMTLSENRNMIILVNDVPQVFEVDSVNSFHNIGVPPEAIDRIEVVRGPMSVIYGTGAFFGVINIFTNQVDEENPVNFVSAAVGSEKTSRLFVRASGAEGDFRYTFNASVYDSVGLDASLEDMGFPLDLSTDELLENQEKYFNFSGSFKGLFFDATYVESEPELMFVVPSISTGMDTLIRTTRVSFGYQHEFSDKVKAEAKIMYSSILRNFKFDFNLLGADPYGVEENAATSYRAQLNMFLTPNPKLNITLGVDYHKVMDVYDDLDIPSFFLENRLTKLTEGESIVTQAAYGQLGYNITDKFRIVAGARVEQVPEYTMEQLSDGGLEGEALLQGTYEQTTAQFIPRVAAIYSFNEQNVIKFLYGRAINRPSFFQNRDLFDPARTPLEPEIIDTLEFNYISYLSSKLSLSLSVFRNILDKLIFRSVFFVGGVYQTYYANVGKMSTNGIELTLKANLSESFQLELSGTYQDTTDERDGFEDIELGYSPKFLAYGKASYFVNNDISLAVTANYVDEMESYWDSTIENPDGSFGSRLGATVESYFLLGANMRVRNLFGTGLFLNIRGSNLLDEEIHYPTTASNTWATLGTIGRGRTFLLTLGWKFK